MINDITRDYYKPMFDKNGFSYVSEKHSYNNIGQCWRLSEKIGEGFFWTYGQKDLFGIKIHDFFLHQDTYMEFEMPKCLSITYHSSISGEELSPHCRLNAGCIQSYIGGDKPYQIFIHKQIPIRSIGIEVMPAYYEKYLQEQYPGEFTDPQEAFYQVGQTTRFPEMTQLLNQVKNYRGKGIAAKLFYEGKVAEAVSLVAEYKEEKQSKCAVSLSRQDIHHLADVTAYLNDHYAYDIPLERLANMACMGTTKLKETFKQYHGCTVTGYIQQRRMSQAEKLLSDTDLPIGQVAQSVGYCSASRFAALFRRSSGLLPGDYRRRKRAGK